MSEREFFLNRNTGIVGPDDTWPGQLFDKLQAFFPDIKPDTPVRVTVPDGSAADCRVYEILADEVLGTWRHTIELGPLPGETNEVSYRITLI